MHVLPVRPPWRWWWPCAFSPECPDNHPGIIINFSHNAASIPPYVGFSDIGWEGPVTLAAGKPSADLTVFTNGNPNISLIWRSIGWYTHIGFGSRFRSISYFYLFHPHPAYVLICHSPDFRCCCCWKDSVVIDVGHLYVQYFTTHFHSVCCANV